MDPFIYRRHVRWGDSDAAGIVYTVRFFDYALEAAEAWFVHVAGHDWFALGRRHGLGMPVVHLDVDFRSPLEPGDEFGVACRVTRLGGASVSLGLTATKDDGTLVFEGTIVQTFLDVAKRRAVRIPEEYRSKIAAFAEGGVPV